MEGFFTTFDTSKNSKKINFRGVLKSICTNQVHIPTMVNKGQCSNKISLTFLRIDEELITDLRSPSIVKVRTLINQYNKYNI